MDTVRFSTAIVACLSALIGSACFLLTSELACTLLIVFGLIQAVVVLLMPRHTKVFQTIALVVSAITMIVTAQTVPRLIHMIAGEKQLLPGSITAFALLSLLSLIHLTLGIKWLAAKKH